MDQKTQFVSEYLRDTISFTELCDRYGISRKTGYKWIDRYQAEGPAGLADRSRRPHSSPDETPEPLRLAIIEARRRHPSWGGKNLLKHLRSKDPQADWPSRSTVCDILLRAGLVRQKTRRRKPGHPGKPISIATAPNDLWCVDFKGQFKTRDGHYCYPLTVTDRYSRYLLGCRALLSIETEGAKATFLRLFKEYGLPQAIRCGQRHSLRLNRIGAAL
jgi:transposase